MAKTLISTVPGTVSAKSMNTITDSNIPDSTVNNEAAKFATDNLLVDYSTNIFKTFDINDIVTNLKDTVTEEIWSDGVGGTLTSAFTSSYQSSSAAQYYLDVYQADPATSTAAEVQYSVAYGDYLGSGSSPITVGTAVSTYTPSQVIYSQYRNVLLAPQTEKFTLGNGTTLDKIVVINFKRDRLKEQLQPGGWELHISGSGAGKMRSLIDDYSSNIYGTQTDAGSVYNIISGSGTTPYLSGSNVVYAGLAYPESGILVLDANFFASHSGVPYVDAVNQSNNNIVTYNAIKSGSYFAAKNIQTINSTYYFTRILNNSYNYSNNPSFTTGSLGDLRYASMIKQPKVYITTVGLYNDSNELLAVAKVSTPIQKSFNSEVNLRIRLDF